MIESPYFSVVIATCNREESLEQCLNMLEPGSQELDNKLYEVIVSDDGEISHNLKQRYAWVKWAKGPKRGPAANRNSGAKNARGKYLVFTDDDCIPDQNWLSAYYEATLQNKNDFVFEGRIYVDRKRQSLGEFSPINENGGVLWSANMLVDRELFNSINGFDERFPYAAMEDVEFHTRIKKRGMQAKFVKNASVHHPWRLRGGWQRCRKHRDSVALFLKIHPEERQRHTPMLFIKMALKGFCSELLPGLVIYRGRGFVSSLLECISNVLMAFRVIIECGSPLSKRCHE